MWGRNVIVTTKIYPLNDGALAGIIPHDTTDSKPKYCLQLMWVRKKEKRK